MATEQGCDDLPFLAFPAILALPANPKVFKLLAAISLAFIFISTTVNPLVPETSPNPVYDNIVRFAQFFPFTDQVGDRVG